MTSDADAEPAVRILNEIRSHFTTEEITELFKSSFIDHMQTRLLSKDSILPLSVRDMEEAVKSLQEQPLVFERYFGAPQSLPLGDRGKLIEAEAKSRKQIQEHRRVLERIRARLREFLGRTEQDLIGGRTLSDVFERNRIYVAEKMRNLAPKAYEEFSSACQRLSDGGLPALSQAATACRRALKSLADSLVEPKAAPVLCQDGKIRDLGDDKYINRLWFYLYERVGASTSGSLLLATLIDMGNRIDALYSLASKGVHASISRDQVESCIVGFYSIAGDILRITDGNVLGDDLPSAQ